MTDYRQQIICVDFDGTIVDHEFPRVGKLKVGVKDALTRLQRAGFYILIWSCRTSTWFEDVFGSTGERKPYIDAMKAALDDNGVPYNEIDDGTRGKPFAQFYIDDRAVTFNDNWPEIAQAVETAVKREKVQCPTP